MSSQFTKRNKMEFYIFHDHALMLHYEDKAKKCIGKYMNLLDYNRYKPPTCFGHLMCPSSGSWLALLYL